MADACINNSSLGNLFCKLEVQLATVTGIKSIGKWNNQILNDAQEDQYEYPAVFIEFSSVEWLPSDLKPTQSNKGQQQKGTVEVTLHICHKDLRDSTDTFETHIAFTKLVWDKINQLQGTYFTPLQRLRDVDDVDHGIIRDWQQTYSTQVTEWPAVDGQVDAAPVAITIDSGLSTSHYL